MALQPTAFGRVLPALLLASAAQWVIFIAYTCTAVGRLLNNLYQFVFEVVSILSADSTAAPAQTLDAVAADIIEVSSITRMR